MSAEPNGDRGAVRIRAAGTAWQNFVQQHRDAGRRAAGRLRRTPVSTAFGILLLAFAWQLPLVLHWVERNLGAMVDALAATHGAHVFLKVDVDTPSATALASRWQAEHPGIRARVVGRDEGLAELASLPGFRNIDTVVGDNPLPIVVSLDHDDAERIEALVPVLQQDKSVDFVQSDARLKRKLRHLQAFVSGAAWIAWSLALCGALLISIHLSRLAVNADRDEISVGFWLGADDAWIRRPLLYGGVLQGFIGAALAVILVLALVAATHRALVAFSQQFAARIELLGPDPATLAAVVAAAVVLGWLGAWTCTSIDLRQLGQTREDSE